MVNANIHSATAVIIPLYGKQTPPKLSQDRTDHTLPSILLLRSYNRKDPRLLNR